MCLTHARRFDEASVAHLRPMSREGSEENLESLNVGKYFGRVCRNQLNDFRLQISADNSFERTENPD